MTSMFKAWLRPQEGPIQVLVFDAMLPDGTTFLFGQGIGWLNEDGDIHATEICRMVLDRLMEATPPDAVVTVLEMKTRVDPNRLASVLRSMTNGGALMVLCGNPTVVDDLLPFYQMNAPVMDREGRVQPF